MRKLMWFTLGFAGACALGAYLLRGTALLILAIVMLLCMGIALLHREDPVFRRVSAVFLGCAIGCCLFCGHDAMRIAPARAADASVRELRFRVSSYSWEGSYGGVVDGEIELDGQTYKMRLYLSEYETLEPGDVIDLTAKLRLTDEGGASAPTFHRTNGILLLGYQRGDAEITRGEQTWTDIPVIFRERLLEILDACVPADAMGFVKALLLAYKVDLPFETGSDFSTTGISHIVAVSGLHVSILFSLVYLLSGKRRYLTSLLGVPCVVFFAAMAGFTPSVTRAAIMQILIMLALLFDREYDPPTALSFAVLVMLAVDPLVIASAGFQLSVFSVAGIYLFSAKLREWILARLPGQEKKRSVPARLGGWLASGISVTLGATVMTTSLVAYYYGTVSLVSVVTNLLVLPVVTLIFYGAMLVCLLGLFSLNAGALVGWLIAWPVRYVCGAAHLLSEVPLAAVYTASPYIVLWLVFAYCLIGWLLITRHPRPLLSLCCGVLGLAVALGLSWAEPLLDEYRVTALDVGQGQCILLQSDGGVYMVDCGGDYPEEAANSAAQLLLSQGISRIDGLILTHYDRDHAGGVPFLSYQIDIDRVYLPDTPDADGLLSDVVRATASSGQIWVTGDMTIAFGSTKITLFAPEAAASGNESCVAVLFQREKYDTLITGDLSAFRERQLIAHGELPDVEVLIAGHHGSKNSTCRELLEAVSPDVVMISVGVDNSYGHPADEVLERLAEYGCAVYRTDTMGTLIYRR